MKQESASAPSTLRAFVPAEHPLRPIREILNGALREMDAAVAAKYPGFGRDSIAPERLLPALLLQTLYSLKSDRLLCEQLGYNMLFRWFVGLGLDQQAWDHATYTKNRDWLIRHQVMRALIERVLERAEGLLSSEHFCVDAGLIRAWASPRSALPHGLRSTPRLTSRETEVLRWTADGKTVDEISELLAISVNTVNFHVKNAVAKLQAANKTAAAVRAAMLGLLDGYRPYPLHRAEHATHPQDCKGAP